MSLEVTSGVMSVIAAVPGSTRDAQPEDSLRGDLDFDALDMLTLVVGLEEAFDIEIHDVEAGRIDTVSDAIRLIENKLRDKPSAL